eukprot:COSAG02_NODE_7079_length_3195_cov_2.652455_3_plen_58_part_00
MGPKLGDLFLPNVAVTVPPSNSGEFSLNFQGKSGAGVIFFSILLQSVLEICTIQFLM